MEELLSLNVSFQARSDNVKNTATPRMDIRQFRVDGGECSEMLALGLMLRKSSKSVACVGTILAMGLHNLRSDDSLGFCVDDVLLSRT